uniref:Uncharacterized protein n=1 Tax=Rhizophora mucronata TaxID=61149 RepID=A0A2P2PVH4_RHIMU
MLSFKKKK